MSPTNESQTRLRQALKYIGLVVISLVSIFPLIWMLLSALKTTKEMFAIPMHIFPAVMHWEHFAQALKVAPFGIYLWNSVITGLCITVIQIILSCMMAYGLTQVRFKGRNFIFQSLLITYMLPAAVTYVPSYVILAKMGLLNSLTGIIISNLGSVFSIFLLRQAFMVVPKEIIEAARMEGSNDWQILWQVMIPMSKATIFTLSLITFIQMYNNYLWPSLIVKEPEKFLVTVGLQQFFTTQGATADQWPLMMAINVITVAPLLILFIIFQKWFIKGLSDSGVKG